MADHPSNPFLALALRYARVGWRLFPLRPQSKSPYARFRWKEQASREVAQITQWWTDYPNANLAVATGVASNLLVLDIDPHNGGTLEVFTALCGGSIPPTLTARTGRDGWHFYFQYPATDRLPEGMEITVLTGFVDDKGKLRGLAQGIDVKGCSGYVLAPPSVHPDTGKTYAWERKVPIAPLPDALLAHILTVLPTPRQDEGEGTDEGVVTGGRNQYLTREAGKLRRDGKNEREIVALLLALNEQRCHPPLPTSEVESIAHSVARYTPAAITTIQRHNQREEQSARREGLETSVPDMLRLDRQEQEIVACILADAELPPAERGDVGTIGTEQQHDLLTDVCTMLQPQHFFTSGVRQVFQAILSLVERGEPYATTCVDAELRGKEGYVGIEVLTSWVTRVTQTDWEPYVHTLCLKVLDASRKRRMLSLGMSLQRDLVQGDMTLSALTTQVREQLDAINEHVGVADNPLTRYAQAYRQQIAQWRTNGHEWLRGESTGIVALDKMTGGLLPGKVWLIGGRASMGKTAWGLSCALVNAKRYADEWESYIQFCDRVGETPDPRKKRHVAILSLEMDGPNLIHRFTGMIAGIPPFAIMRGRYDAGHPPEEWHTPIDDGRLHTTIDAIERLPLLMVDAVSSFRSTNGSRGKLSTHAIAQRVQAWQQEHSVGVVIVDYLQLVKPPEDAQRESRERQVAAISEAFKALAMERRVPVVVLAQLNRTVEHREGRLPQLSDIRESGAVEQDIDIACLLFRKEYYQARGVKVEQDEKSPATEGVVQLWIAKHRDGETGSRDAFFDAPVMRYYDYDVKTDTVKNFWGQPVETELRKLVYPFADLDQPSGDTDLVPPPKRMPVTKVWQAPGAPPIVLPDEDDDEFGERIVETYSLAEGGDA